MSVSYVVIAALLIVLLIVAVAIPVVLGLIRWWRRDPSDPVFGRKDKDAEP